MGLGEMGLDKMGQNQNRTGFGHKRVAGREKINIKNSLHQK